MTIPYASRSLSSLPHWIESVTQEINEVTSLRESIRVLSPKEYSIQVAGLSISAPIARSTIPIIGLPLPRFMGKKRRYEGDVAKELLRNVSLSVKSGELAAIIGGSGSGKSECYLLRSFSALQIAVLIHAPLANSYSIECDHLSADESPVVR